MSKSVFDYIGNLDTLLAVALGAVLATTGALTAEFIQERLKRRQRERETARFVGEIMSMMDRIVHAALRSHEIGDPWGPVTRRLLRTALHEAQIYERNRERLFDIRDMELRNRIHEHMVRKTFPVDAIIDYCAELDTIDEELLTARPQMTPERVERLEGRAAFIRESVDFALEALKTEVAGTAGICADLEKLAGVSFSSIMGTRAPSAAASPDSGGEGRRSRGEQPRHRNASSHAE